jgi:NAD(P)-dependent dehydrogenase (short-subunit alcohol dehydrogenase family)
MANKVLVIGGTSGIGGVITQSLRSRGDEVFAEGSSTGFDVTYSDVKSHVCKYILNRGVTCVVYNAGTYNLEPLEDVTYGNMTRVFEVNVFGCLDAMAGFAKSVKLVQNPKLLRMVVISSVAGRIPMSYSSVYCASKAAVSQAMRCAARELGGYGATVNSVAPGSVADSDMAGVANKRVASLRRISEEDAQKALLSAIPMKRQVTKQEVADAVLFLLSDQASGITGQEISVSGGM